MKIRSIKLSTGLAAIVCIFASIYMFTQAGNYPGGFFFGLAGLFLGYIALFK